MVFESLISNVLSKYLGNYVYGLSEKNLKFGIWKGDIVLHNLAFKPDSLLALKLPLIVKGGYIGKLSLKIPWSNLQNEAIVIYLQDVYAVINPDDKIHKVSGETAEDFLQAAKMKSLEELEAQEGRDHEKELAKTTEEQQGVFRELVTKVIDNIQIEINNIHIRYEPVSVANLWHPNTIFGVTLDHISILSTDPNFIPSFISVAHTTIFKLLVMKSFGLYCNTNDKPLYFSSSEEMGTLLKERIYFGGRGTNPPNSEYIVYPISLHLKAIVQKNEDASSGIPRVTVESVMDEIVLSLSELQYRNILELSSYFTALFKRWAYRDIRPPVRPNEDPKAWWKYIVTMLSNETQKKHRRYKWTASMFSEKRKARLEYIGLFKDKLRGKALSDDEKERLSKYEKKLSVNELYYFRTLARQDLKNEGIDIYKKHRPWWKFWEQPPLKEDFPRIEANEIHWDERQKQLLYTTFEFDSVAARKRKKKNLPPDYQKVKVNLILKKGSLLLLGRNQSSLGKLEFIHFGFALKIFPKTISVVAYLVDVKLLDCFTPNTQYPVLVAPILEKSDHFFDFELQYLPPNSEDVDILVKLQAEPLQIMLNLPFILRIVDFFTSTEEHIEEAENQSVPPKSQKIKKIKEKYSEQISWVMESKKNLDIDLRFEAPKILIVDDWTSPNAKMILANLGKVSILCSPEDQVNDTELEELVYYTLKIRADNLDLSTTTTKKWVKGISAVVIEKFQMDFILEICLITKNTELPMCRLMGEVPNLNLQLCANTIKDLYIVLLSLSNGETVPSLNGGKGEVHPSKQISNSPKDDHSAIKNVYLEGAFSIKSIAISIKDNNLNKQMLLASLETINAHILYRKYDIKVDAGLERVRIDDHIQPHGQQFQYLMQSDPAISPYLKVSYVFVFQDCPYNKDNVQSVLEVEMGILKVEFNRSTVVELIQFFEDVKKLPNTITKETPTSEGGTVSVLHEVDQPSIISIAEDEKSTLKLTLWGEAIHLSFNKDNQTIGLCNLGGLSLYYDLHPKTDFLVVSLGELSVKDPLGARTDIISMKKNDQVVHLTYKTYSDQVKGNYPGYGADFLAKINTIQFIYVDRFTQEMISYFTDISEMNKLFKTTGKMAGDTMTALFDNSNTSNASSDIKYSIIAHNPQVLIPDKMSDLCVLTDFGQIFFYNKLKLFKDPTKINGRGIRYEKIYVSLANMNIQSLHCKRPHGIPQTMLKNLSFVVSADRQTETNLNNVNLNEIKVTEKSFYEYAPVRILIDIPKIDILLTQEQFYLLVDIINQNIIKAPSKSSTSQKIPKFNKTSISYSINIKLGDLFLSFLGKHQLQALEPQNDIVLPSPMLRYDAMVQQLENVSHIQLAVTANNLDKKDIISGSSDPYIVVYRLSGKLRVKIYQSEIIYKNINPKWKPFLIPVADIFHEETLIFQVFDYDPLKNDEIIGEFETSLRKLLRCNSYQLIKPWKQNIKNEKKKVHIAGTVNINIQPVPMEKVLQVDQNLDKNKSQNQESLPLKSKKENENIFMNIKFNQLGVKIVQLNDNSMFVLGSLLTLEISGQAKEIGIKNIAEMSEIGLEYYSNINSEQKLLAWISSTNINMIPCIVIPMKDILIPGFMRLSAQTSDIKQNNGQNPVIKQSPPNPFKMDVILDMGSISILFMEDPTKQTTRTCTLTVPMKVILSFYDNVQKINGLLYGLRVFKGNEENELLHPTTIEFNYYVEHKSSFGIHSQPIELILSKQDFDILTGVYKTFTCVPTTNFITEYNQQQTSNQSTQQNTPMSIFMNIDSVNVVLVHECIAIPPLIRVGLQNLKFRGIYPDSICGEISLVGSYYNMKNTFWEPLIEDWICTIEYKTTSNPYQNVINIEANKVLSLNLTSALLDMFNLWYKDIKSKEGQFHALTIRNLTSTHCRVLLSQIRNPLEISPWKKLPLELNYKQNLREVDVLSDFTLNAQVEGLHLESLPTVKQGISVFPIEKDKKALVYEIIFYKGARTFLFRSNIKIINNTIFPLLVKLSSEDSSKISLLDPIKPKDYSSVPLEFVSDGSIYFKPDIDHNNDFFWSSKLVLNKLAPELFYLSLSSNSESQFSYCVDIQVEKSKYGVNLYTIKLCAPVVLENLLQCSMKYRINDSSKSTVGILQEGEGKPNYEVSLNRPIRFQILLSGYRWSEEVNINATYEGTITIGDNRGRILTLFYEHTYKKKTLYIVIYSKYWIVNRTPFYLRYYNSHDSLAAGQDEFLEENTEFPPSIEKITPKKPFLFSFKERRHHKHAYIQTKDSKLSVGISFEAVNVGELVVEKKSSHGAYYFAIAIEIGGRKFRRTKVVTISPRYLFLNKLPQPIYYQQIGCDRRVEILPDQMQMFNWENRKVIKHISVSLDMGNTWTWSGEFPLDQIDEIYLKLVKPSTNDGYFIRVSIKSNEKGTICVTFDPERQNIYPYRIENCTNDVLTLWQEQNGNVTHTVAPQSHLRYAWDEPVKPHLLRIQMNDKQFKHSFQLDVIKEKFLVGEYQVTITTDGLTRLLKINHRTEFVEQNSETVSAVFHQSEPENPNQAPNFIFDASLSGIDLSIVDDTPTELIYVLIEGVESEVMLYEHNRTFELIVHDVQIDNQLYFTPYPKLLRATVIDKNIIPPEFFHLSIVQFTKYKGLTYFHYFGVLLQEIDIFLDSTVLNSLFKFMRLNVDKIFADKTDVNKQINSLPSKEELTNASMVYFEKLEINSVKMNISLYTPPYREKGDDDLIYKLIGGIVPVVPNIDSAPLKLNALVLEHPFTTSDDLYSRISSHYISQLIKKSYRILGSFEFLGNPVNVIASLGTGFKDFFYEPVHGVVQGPQGFVIGLKKGSKSLAVRSSYSFCNSTGKFASQMSSGLISLSGDKEYKLANNLKRLNKPKHFTQGVAVGVKDFSKGIYAGITGVVKQPIKEMKEEGTSGFFKGLGKGIIGVGVKPTAGIFDLFARTFQGISGSILDQTPHRARLPRHFDKNIDNVLQPYSWEKAFRQYALYCVKQGKYSLTDQVSYHLILDSYLYMITDHRVLCISVDFTEEIFQLKWTVPYSKIGFISQTHFGEIRIAKIRNGSKTYVDEDGKSLVPAHRIEKEYMIGTDKNISDPLYDEIFKQWNQWHEINPTTVTKRPTSRQTFFQKMKSGVIDINIPEKEKAQGGSTLVNPNASLSTNDNPSNSQFLRKPSHFIDQIRKNRKDIPKVKEIQDSRAKEELLLEQALESKYISANTQPKEFMVVDYEPQGEKEKLFQGMIANDPSLVNGDTQQPFKINMESLVISGKNGAIITSDK